MGPFLAAIRARGWSISKDHTMSACLFQQRHRAAKQAGRSIKIGEWFSPPPSCSALPPSVVAAAHYDDARGAIRTPLVARSIFPCDEGCRMTNTARITIFSTCLKCACRDGRESQHRRSNQAKAPEADTCLPRVDSTATQGKCRSCSCCETRLREGRRSPGVGDDGGRKWPSFLVGIHGPGS